MSITISTHMAVKSSQYHRISMLFFSVSGDLRLMKPHAEAFIREHFYVSMFWGEHLHVLYSLNEKVPHGYSISSDSSTGTPPRL